jgi:hypothetical protein
LELDPQTLDLEPLMTQTLNGLESAGYVVTEAPQAFDTDSGSDGIYAIVQGSEVGYVALVPFGQQIAYITGTGTPDSFEANRAVLEAIVRSVRVPAELPTTPGPGLPGLQGLSPSATPSPSAGVPGLGGLQNATVTPEATAGD